MGSSTSNVDNINCITTANTTSRQSEIVQYDDKGNIVYYYRAQNNFMNNDIIMVLDMYDKEIGSIERVANYCLTTYNFYDEYKQIIFYIEERGNVCPIIYTFYGADKNSIATITSKSGCLNITFDEYDKYNTKTYGVRGKTNCSANTTYYENDSNGNTIFIIRESYNCGNCIFKIYDQNEKEINFSDRTLFSNGFTNIQKLIILSILFQTDSE